MGHVIGLLGGVASGKSTVAGMLAARGLVPIDADVEARKAVENPTIRGELSAHFGADLFDADGRLDRAELARRAFSDPERTAELNAIVHPEVRRRVSELLAAAAPRPVVLDVPLLLESPLASVVTTWVFVESGTERREQRARERGWSPQERALRESRQTDLETKRRRADHLLENNGSIDDLETHVDALLAELGLPVGARDGRDPEP